MYESPVLLCVCYAPNFPLFPLFTGRGVICLVVIASLVLWRTDKVSVDLFYTTFLHSNDINDIIVKINIYVIGTCV